MGLFNVHYVESWTQPMKKDVIDETLNAMTSTHNPLDV